MAATTDPHEALFLMFYALYAADTGSGGLVDTVTVPKGDQYVQHFLRAHGQQAQGHPGIPRIEFEVVDDRDESPFMGDSPTCRVRMHLYTIRDPGSVQEAAVLLRMRTVFRRAKLSTQGGWYGGQVNWRRSPRAPSAIPNENHRIVECTTKIGV